MAIHIKKSHRGLLHKNLGVAKGKKIPASKLAIHKGDSPALKKRKQFAINAKKWHHQDGGILHYQKGGLKPKGGLPAMSPEARQKAIYEPNPMKIDSLRAYSGNKAPLGVSQKVFNATKAVSKFTKKYQVGGLQAAAPDIKSRFNAGTDNVINRDVFDQFENNTLDVNHPFNNMLPGYRKQVLTAFRQDPTLSEVTGSSYNLGHIPQMIVNGQPQGALGTNTEQFHLTEHKYNPAVPAQQAALPAQVAVVPAQPVQVQATSSAPKPLKPAPVANTGSVVTATHKSNKKYKPTDPYAAYPKRYRRKMGYQVGGFSGAPPATAYNPNYIPINPNTSVQQNLIKATLNRDTAKNLQNAVRGSGTVPQLENDITKPMSVMPGGVINRYANLKPQTLTTADSVYNASTAYLNKYKGFEIGGIHLSPETMEGYVPGDATVMKIQKGFQNGGYSDMNTLSAQHMQATYSPKKNKNLKKHFAAGGAWSAGGAGASGAAALGSTAGSLVSGIGADKYGVTSTGAAIGGGALSGAALGTTILPGWGTLIGAVIGGAVGGIKNKMAKNKRTKALEGIARAQKVEDANQSETALANYDNQGTGVRSFTHGGLHPATQPKVLHGYLVSAPGGYGNDGSYHFTDRSFLTEKGQNNKKLKAGYQQGGEMAGAAMSGVSQMIQPLMPEDIETKRKRTAALIDSGERFGYGGKDWARAQGVYQNGGMAVDGGNLQPISDNAYEVKGDNPQATDDVQFQDAFVDHGEVMKPKAGGTEIFSNHLTLPGTKTTFAKAAKKLEKSKSLKGNQNPNQDALIESKLKALFHTQQRLNDNSQGESTEEAIQPAGETPGRGMTEGNMFKLGGLSPKNVTYHDINPKRIGSLAKEAMATGVISKKYYNTGGTMAEKLFEVPGFKKELRTEPGHEPGAATFQGGGIAPAYNVNQVGKNYLGWGSYKPINNPVPTGQQQVGGGSNINWSAVAGLGASLAGNIHNTMALKNMPDVAEVSLTKAPRLRKLDYSDQKAMLREGLNTALKAGAKNSTMRQAQEGSQAASLSEYSRATNQMHGDVNRTNAQIGNEEAQLGWRNNLNNNQLTNQYRQDQQHRLSAIMSGESANIADVGNKVQGFVAQGNAMKLDQQKLDMNLAQLEISAPGAGYRHLKAMGYTDEEAKLAMSRVGYTLSGKMTPQGKRNGGFVSNKKPLSYNRGGGLRRMC